MTSLADLALTVAAVPTLLACGYLLLLALGSRRTRPPKATVPRLGFAFVVPAHDEEAGISATVESLRAVDYPEALRRVWVVADNCRDATAVRARAAGAEVLERVDAERRGKGYALELAFTRLLEEGWADAVVVVDADTIVSPNLLHALAARLEAGAGAIQCSYGVRNPEASWRTRLMSIAFALFNTMRSIARERSRCSVGLKGNGMCFSVSLLREIPHHAYSMVEDVEYGIRLALEGRRVHFAGEAQVLGEMVPDAAASRSQRRRWEEGRRALRAQYLGPLLRQALARRDRVALDLALELLVPPLATVAVAVACGLALSLAIAGARGGAAWSPWAWGACAAALVAYVARGWWISGTGLRGLAALLRAPVYVVWKMGLALSRGDRPRGAWVRTRRATESTRSAEPPGGAR
jgi:1,2-diacylglycerol 3-beta-glucosyltransferase